MADAVEVQPAPLYGVKQAVRVAMDYFRDLYPDPLEELLPEEAELAEDGRYWLITLGFKAPASTRTLVQSLHGVTARAYKVFKVDAQTGKVESMKIRPLP